MELEIHHSTVYRYNSPAKQVGLLLRLQPAHLDCQAPRNWSVTINGLPVQHFTPNGFGDLEAFVQHRGTVGQLEIVAEGTVSTRECNGIVSGFRHDLPLPVFLRPTELTCPDENLKALARSVPGEDLIAKLHALSDRVRERVSYVPGATDHASTAAEALAQGQGVCQDHAHIFVAAARTLGVPARYVAGYLLADAGDLAQHETHGWAEAWVEGLGWIGFDATNGLCVTERYVRLCCGLDAHDAAPVRGSVMGTTAIEIQADVMIGEVAPVRPQQEQQQQ